MIRPNKDSGYVVFIWAAFIAMQALALPVPSGALTVWNTDYSIVALDVETGETIWESCPGRLGFPHMCLEGGIIEATWNDREYQGTETLIEEETGRVIGASEKELDFSKFCQGIQFLDMRKPNKTTSDGRVITWGEDGIFSELSVTTSQIRRFSGHASQINVVRDLAVFYWSAHSGEVYALDSLSGEISWGFEGWRFLQPDEEQERSTYLFVFGEKLFVFYSANLFCLDILTGRVAWQRKVNVPTPLVSGEGTGPLVWPVGESVLAVYYEWLYFIDADGDLVWEYDAGIFGGTLPLLANSRLYVASRPHARRELRKEVVPSKEKSLRITWSDNAFNFEHVLLQDVPDNDPVWSELNHPEVPAGNEDIVLNFLDTEVHRIDRTWSLDVSSVLKQESAIYVRYDSEIDFVRVAVGGEVRAEHPLSPLSWWWRLATAIP